MAIGKKAYFFSITVLLLVGVAALIMSGARDPGHLRSATLANQRLTELQTFMEGVEQDAITATAVATHRALLTSQELVQTQGALTDPEATIEELIINGTYEGTIQPLLLNESLERWAEHLQPLANHLRMTINVTINEVAITQYSPWFVTTITNATLKAQDNYTSSSWQQTFIANATTPILGLADPLYTIGTDGRYTHIINKATSIADLASHVRSNNYSESADAPRFIDRFGTNPGSSEHGIESLVNVEEIIAINVNNDGSIIDWQYFGTNVPSTCPLPGLPAWAVIDPAQSSRYGITCP